MPSARGFCITYTSARRLDADHAAYLTHGGLLLPIGIEDAPDPETPLEVKLEIGDRSFTLPGEAGHMLPGRGLMVAFSEAAGPAMAELDAFLGSDGFRADKRTEAPGEGAAPTVQNMPVHELEDIATDPHLLPPALIDTDAEVPASPEPPPAAPSRRRRAIPASAAQPVPDTALDDTTAADPGTAPEFGPPEPGEAYFIFVVKFTTVTPYVAPAEAFGRSATFTVPFEDDGLTEEGSTVKLRLTLPGRHVFEMWGRVQGVTPDAVLIRVDRDTEPYRKAVLYPSTVSARARLDREANLPPEAPSSLRIKQEVPTENLERMPIRRRLARMGMDDKINLALSGGREERMAIAMDGNKAIHHYLLKNAKLTLDEVAFMARLPSFNPDVLDKIAENPAYTQNPTITKALVYNPRTPVKTAIRLLDRLPRSEIMNLAKRTTMNARLVMAAKKKLERGAR